MKKKLLASLLAGSALLAGCDMLGGGEASGATEVTIWADGSDNVRDAYEEVIEAFNNSEYGEEYQLSMEFIVSGSGGQSLGDRLLAAYQAGEENTEYDLVGINEGSFQTMVSESDEGLFNEIDYSQIPNSENLTVDVRDHFLPIRGTTVVLAYDSERVENVPTTDEELYEWIRENPGRFSYNDPDTGGAGSAFVRTAVYNYLPEEALTSDDPSWVEEWDEGFALLEELHPYLYQTGGQTVYPNTNQGTLDLLANQEVDMIPAWADMAIEQTLDGRLPETTAITQIEPSFTGDMPGFAAPSIGSANSDAIHAVLDFWISDEAQEILLDSMAAIPLVDSSNFDSESAGMLEGFDVSEFRVSEIGTLGGDLNERWHDEIAPLP
jgi:putative spermidine/putrescine transport system substrate-binding protein